MCNSDAKVIGDLALKIVEMLWLSKVHTGRLVPRHLLQARHIQDGRSSLMSACGPSGGVWGADIS